MTSTLTSLLSDAGPFAVLVLALVIFAETGLLVGFFLPGDSLLFTAGLLVASGVLNVPLVVVILVTWIAGALGDQVAYWIGGKLGKSLFVPGRSRWISVRHVRAAHEFFAHHGHKAVILARFVPLARTFTPVVAGAVEMPRRRFTTYNIAGGLLWTASMSLAGYFLGGVPIIADHVDIVVVGIVALSLVPAAIAFLRGRQAKGGSAEAGAPGDQAVTDQA
ncbi:MAG: VTT domain-containing protein [Nocardioides sp.]|uniref:VTT domain-containing protein n=1 Tax=Nocardioides sp. TaxID=35761 RepID=UPI0039E38F61